MGQAKRRRDAHPNKQPDIKISPRKRAAGFKFAHYSRREIEDDGTVFTINFFAPVDENGDTMVEETPDGPRPVLLQSVAQPIRRTVIATAGLVAVR